MKINLLIFLVSVCSYLFGSINWAIIISKSKNKDIRKVGSGNPGTLNMSRNFGLKFGLLTFALDILKGAIPVLITFFIFRNAKYQLLNFKVYDFAIYCSGLSAVLGHIFPLFLKFNGGKGIATTIGVFIVCTSIHGVGWLMVSIMALVFAGVFIYLTEFGAMGSFIAITPPAISESIRLFLIYGIGLNTGLDVVLYISTNMLILSICFFTWFAHRKNIERMLSGDEHPTSIKSIIVKAKVKKLNKE